MKKKMTVLCGLLMAVLVTAYSVSGTYAKYTSSMETTDSARVARWSINVGEKEALGLFQLAYGANDEIKSSNTDLVVAPGASGEVDINITGTAEVAYKLVVDIDETKSVNDVRYADGNVSPIKFSLDGSNWFEYEQLETQLKTALGDNTYAANSTLNKSVKLYWKWAYDKAELDGMTGITATTGWDADKYDAEDTKLGTKYQGTITDAEIFAAVKASEDAWKYTAWASIEDVADDQKEAFQAAFDAYKAAHSSASDPNITIVLSITATQVEPTAPVAP